MKPDYIPWILSLLSFLVAYFSLSHNVRKDEKAENGQTADKFEGLERSIVQLGVKLDVVGTTTAETRTDVKSLNKDIQNIDRRVAILERDVKTAFDRIDELKGEIYHD